MLQIASLRRAPETGSGTPHAGTTDSNLSTQLGSQGLKTPLYHQIYLILKGQITDGVYSTDARLPSEQDLTERFGVSRITAKRAMDELAAEGLVVRERARGTRVIYQPPSAPIASSVEGLLENLIAMGLETTVKLLEFAYLPAPNSVAEALEIERGAEVQRAVRVRTLDSAPFSHLTTYVPSALGRQFSAEELSSLPLLSLLERCGVKVDSASQTISATLADHVVAKCLGTDPGAALMKISRVVRDQNGMPVEFITALYRPDRYQYRMSLSRVQGETEKRWAADDNADKSELLKAGAS
ncbi:GntR family transcriptional regulator [Denitrobaculum tricleocarpae]|uniref:GntR family transcriptional regulator n=1 Tax=Denitrobaculum tricleocarpae TaxID=2591009 RepID=A0A545TG17_9PROT|nr:GntR family transcriptional regulator [Denitrobaculum tricleocarpae]TQV76167.1 GntR family transcriptional regulator [Denitrobaculum tricleocarpae]